MLKRKAGPGLNRSTAFDWINYTVMVLLAFIMVYPLWYCVAGSFNEGMDYLRGGVFLWPRKWTLANYKAVFLDSAILNAFWVTIWKCLVGTVTSVLCTAMVAYAITRPKLRLKKLYIPFIMLTMFFSGGLIPYFILIVDLGLYDSFWVYVIPTMFSAYNMIIIQSFMRELPSELIESAKLDGASEYRIFFQMILPLSKPVLATIALFTVVTHWNSYFDSMMYTSSQELQTIQLFLKKVITDPSVSRGLGSAATIAIPDQAATLTPQVVKLATMVVTALPVVCIYPFLQRYFVKGVTVGAIKG